MNNQPRNAIENGFTNQFTNSVTPMPLTCLRTSPSALKSTLTSIGIIMIQMSNPTGRLTWAISMRPMAWNTLGNNCPRAIPATMHKNTHTVRYRSNTLMGATAACLTVTLCCTLMLLFLGQFARRALQQGFLQLGGGQADQNVQAALERMQRLAKGFEFLRLRAFARRRVRVAPVCGGGLARPVGADLASGVVADGDHQVHVRGIRRAEFIPGFD